MIPKSYRPRAGWFVVLLILLVVFLALSSCESQPTLVLEPRIINSRKISGDIWVHGATQDKLISPDGEKCITVVRDSDGTHVVSFPIGEDGNGSKLFSVTDEWASNNLAQFYPLGWTNDGEPLFLFFGWHESGVHRGKRGLSLMLGDASKCETREIYYMDLPSGIIQQAHYYPDKNSVYFHVSGEIWQISLADNSARVVIGGLPTYDGLFHPVPSPDFDHFVYGIHEEMRSSIAILNTRTGEQRRLLESDDAISFYPIWSPDGQYIAVYTASKKPTTSPTPCAEYDIVPAEDGPMPLARTITVVDVQGRVVKEFSVPDKYLMYFRFSKDSRSIAAFSVTVECAAGEEGVGYPSDMAKINYDALWRFDMDGKAEPSRLTTFHDLEKTWGTSPTWVYPLLVEADGVYFQAANSQEVAAWFVTSQGSLNKVADGYWEMPEISPEYLGHRVCIISDEKTSGLYTVSSGKATKFSEFASTMGHAQIAGFDDRILIIVTQDYSGAGEAWVTVYEMVRPN